MPTILCFGDSNTHGTPPMTAADQVLRLGPEERWTRVMARSLGAGWELIEEGLPGRTTVFDEAMTGPTMNGAIALPMALRSHGPIDWLTIMLGTNDCQAQFGASPERIAGGLARLLVIANNPELQARHGGFQTLVIAPPPIAEQGTFAEIFLNGREKSLALSHQYRALADAFGARFLDAASLIEVSQVDGVHFDAAAHEVFGKAIAEVVGKQ